MALDWRQGHPWRISVRRQVFASQAERNPSPGTHSVGPLILDFRGSRTVRKKCLLFKPPSLCYSRVCGKDTCKYKNSSISTSLESICNVSMREGAFYTRRVSGKMTRRHSVRLLFLISLALEMIHVGNSYQREKYKRSREEINNAPAQKLQQKTLNWTLNNFREMNDSADGWRPRGAFPHSPALQERAPLGQRRCCRTGGTCMLGSSACPRPLHRSLLRAGPEAQRMRRPGARSLDLPRLPPLQVRLCGPALPPPPDTRPLPSERLPGLPR
nr:uncharacterized protein LOC105090756 isoform X1 [Camelus dromedarius]